MIYLTLLRTRAKFHIDNASFGIWGGILYLATGGFGLTAANKRTKFL